MRGNMSARGSWPEGWEDVAPLGSSPQILALNGPFVRPQQRCTAGGCCRCAVCRHFVAFRGETLPAYGANSILISLQMKKKPNRNEEQIKEMAAVIYLSHLESVTCVADKARTSQNTFSSVSLPEILKLSLCLENNFHGNLFPSLHVKPKGFLQGFLSV